MKIQDRLAALPHTSKRKLALFACQCARLIWHLLEDESKRAIEAAEGYVNGKVSKKVMKKAAHAAWQICERNWEDNTALWHANITACCAAYASHGKSYKNNYRCVVKALDHTLRCDSTHEHKLSEFFDDIFGIK